MQPSSQINHLVVSFTGGTASIYINSILIGTLPFNCSGAGFEQLYVGNNKSPVVGWTQIVRSVSIYNYAMSASEINQYYRLERGLTA